MPRLSLILSVFIALVLMPSLPTQHVYPLEHQVHLLRLSCPTSILHDSSFIPRIDKFILFTSKASSSLAAWQLLWFFLWVLGLSNLWCFLKLLWKIQHPSVSSPYSNNWWAYFDPFALLIHIAPLTNHFSHQWSQTPWFHYLSTLASLHLCPSRPREWADLHLPGRWIHEKWWLSYHAVQDMGTPNHLERFSSPLLLVRRHHFFRIAVNQEQSGCTREWVILHQLHKVERWLACLLSSSGHKRGYTLHSADSRACSSRQ